MGTISIPAKVDFPAAYRRGIDKAHGDINAGGDAVGLALHRMLGGVLSSVTREGANNAPVVEVTKIFRDTNLEASRLEKHTVRRAQELVDELAGYIAAIGAFTASASSQGVKAVKK